jgi:hypothetical protein
VIMHLLEAFGDVIQAPGPEPTIPDGPIDLPGVEVPRDAPSQGFDLIEQYGSTLAIIAAAGILIYAARRVINAIPWKVVGPIVLLIVFMVYLGSK